MATLAERMRAQRQRWVDLPGGKHRLLIERPRETEFSGLARGVTADHAVGMVVGWQGFTEADLLGPAVGSSDEVPFDPAAWGEYVRDRLDVLALVSGAVADDISKHLQQRELIAKN